MNVFGTCLMKTHGDLWKMLSEAGIRRRFRKLLLPSYKQAISIPLPFLTPVEVLW